MSTLTTRWKEVLVAFVEDLTQIPEMPMTAYLCLQGVSYYMKITESDALIMPMYRFVASHIQDITCRNEGIFLNFEARTGNIRHLLNTTRQLWPLLSDHNKEAIWKWFDSMAKLSKEGEPVFE